MIAVIFWCLLSVGVGVLLALFASWFLTRHRREIDFLEDHFKRRWW